MADADIRLSNAARLLLDCAILVDRAILIMVIRTFALNEYYASRTVTSMAIGVVLSLVVFVIVYMSPMCRKAHARFGTLTLIKLILFFSAVGCLLCAMHLHLATDALGLSLISIFRPTEPVLMHAVSTAASEVEFINFGRTQTMFRLLGTSVGVILGGAAYWSHHWSSVQICFAIFCAWYAAIFVALAAAGQYPSCCDPAIVENRLHLSIRPINANGAPQVVVKLLQQLKYEAFWLSSLELMLVCGVFFYAAPEGEYPAAVGLVLAQLLSCAFLLAQPVDVDWMFSKYYIAKIVLVLLALFAMPTSTILFHVSNNGHWKEAIVIVILIIPYITLVQVKDYSMPFWVKVTHENRPANSLIESRFEAISTHYSQMFSAQMVSEVAVTLLFLFLMPLGMMAELICTIGVPFSCLFVVISVKEKRQAISVSPHLWQGGAIAANGSAHAIHKEINPNDWVAPPFDLTHFPSGVNPLKYSSVPDSAASSPQDTLVLSSTNANAEPPNAEQMRDLSSMIDAKHQEGGAAVVSPSAVPTAAVALTKAAPATMTMELTAPKFTIEIDPLDAASLSGAAP